MKETEFINISAKEGGFTQQDKEWLRRAGEVLRGGGLVAFPTETVYGLGGDAMNPDSSRLIYAAKGRPSDNPLIIHIADFEALSAIVPEIPEEAVRLAEVFWPGPLTMILPKSDAVPYETTGGLETVAVRMPSHPVALALIREGGGYVAAPSANLSGKPSPTSAAYVAEDMDGRIDMIIDGGEVGIGLESTIVDLTVSPPRILRPGYITREMLEQVLGEVGTDATILRSQQDCGEAPKAPGMKYRHYAPVGELTIVSGTPDAVAAYINQRADEDRTSGEKVGVIGTEEMLAGYRSDVVKSVGRRGDEETIARRLYAILRELDDEGVTKIYSESFSAEGFGQAIMNRLLKAAGHHVVEV
ncbi:MAG: L-threonylcarbamoyladenylate synthase [Butyrivibrio sp.]|nr:L-threonylcarbamoyladenylate synthase [Muribaculum sp.]MCM1551159.1 L-threonylcarbamoyladenylate synthase [Butyrivibrio sp.]